MIYKAGDIVYIKDTASETMSNWESDKLYKCTVMEDCTVIIQGRTEYAKLQLYVNNIPSVIDLKFKVLSEKDIHYNAFDKRIEDIL